MVELTIGSDPEFILVSGEKQIPARNVFRSSRNRTTTPLGVDGYSDTGELRPKPASDPIQHFRNLRELMHYSWGTIFRDEWVKKNHSTNLKMCAGSTGAGKGYYLGGHIHFSSKTKNLQDTIIQNNISRALDQYLALPMLFIEQKPYNINRRVRSPSRFGALSATQSKRWGFEYRTLSSWLISPDIAKGVLCLAYTIAYEVLLKDKIVAQEIKRNFEDAFNNANTESLKSALPVLFKKIKKFQLYKTYKKQINYIYKRALSEQTWDESCDVWYNWRGDSPRMNNLRNGQILTHTPPQPQQDLVEMFTFNLSDEYLSMITDQVLRRKVTKDQQIAVFGLRGSKQYKVSTTNPRILPILLANGFHSTDLYLGEVWAGHGQQIGFRLDVRKYEQDKIVTILNQIAGDIQNV